MSTEETNETGQSQEAQDNSNASSEGGARELPKDVQDKLDELERVKAHQQRLLDETKEAKRRAQELEESQQQEEEKRKKENGEFQTLYETEREKAERLDRELKERDKREAEREIQSEANLLASELTRDTSRSELVSEKIQAFSEHTENGVIYKMGGVQVDKTKVVEYLKEKYPFLVDGSGATGGGATGSNKNGGAVKTFGEYTGAELKAIKDSDPEQYARLRDEYYRK